MKVKELVQRLGSMDAELDVYCWTEQESGFTLLEIESVAPVAGQLVRGADNVPGFKIGSGAPSIVALTATADF